MAYRQRNTPVPSKSDGEVQTDVRLLESNLLLQQRQQEQLQDTHSDMRLSRTYNTNGLLRPFTDQQLLKQFSRTLQQLRSSQPSDNLYAKRLELLEKQIDGLLKRDVLINSVAEGEQSWNSYYLTLNEKQKTIIRLQNEKIHTDVKIQRLQNQINTADQQISSLRLALINSQQAVQQNKLYASFYQKVNQVVTNGQNKGIELLQVIEEHVVPLTSELSFNLAGLTRTINRDIHQSTRAVVLNLAKEFDRLLKEQLFNEEKLNDIVTGLINNFKAVRGVDYLKQQFELSSRTQLAQDNYRNLLSLLKHQIQVIRGEGKVDERFNSLLRRLEQPGIELLECKGWVNLVSPQIRVIETGVEHGKLRQLVGVLGAQFKRVYFKFPELKNHVSPKLMEILQSSVLNELIEGGSIEKLESIVLHNVETVRVDNVYQYESSIDRKTVFHLRVLIKRLLEQLQRIKSKHKIEFELDQGILGLMKEQIIDGFNTGDYISLFRPIPKIVQVPVVVETPVYQTKTFETAVPINTEKEILLREEKVNVVSINKEVPVYIQKPIDHIVNTNIPITIQTQKVVPVQVVRQVAVQRVVESSLEVPTIREKAVPVYEREQVIRQVEVEKVIEKVQFKQVEKIVEAGGREYIQIERVVEKPVYLYETRQQIKQVEVKVPQIIRQTEYVQIEKRVPYVVEHREIVNIEREVPIQIRVPQVDLVQVIEYRDKPVVVKQYKQVVKQIPVTKEKQLLRETAKQIFIERSHFVKSDQVEVIREVEVFVDRPIIHEVLTTRDVEIEKVVPLYISEQVPVIHEIAVPYIEEKVRELDVQIVRVVPVREEIVKPIHVEKPVPVVVQKQVVRVQKHIVQHIVEKIVQVPRVVQVERIVEKIVVVPRIVERIVQVPRIIEKIVIVEQPVLQIVEIQVPHIVIQEVEKIVEVVVQKIVVQYQKQIQYVEVQKVVEKIIERDRIVEVQVERRVPYEVIRQVPVPTYRDRVEYQKREIHETKVETIEVQVPFLFQEQVPFYVEKPIVTEHLVEQPVYEKLYIQKQKPIINEVEKLVVHEVTVQKPVVTEVIRQIPGPETIKYIYEPRVVEVFQEKIVQLHDRVQVPKEIYLLEEKVVHEIHEKLVEVPVNTIVMTPQLIEVPKLVHLTHYKEVALQVPIREERLKRDILEQVKTVQVVREVPVEVQILREKIKQITNQIRQYITSQVVREIRSEVEVPSQIVYQQVPVVGRTVFQQINNSSNTIQIQERIIEKVVQKIVMLPQIVQVVRNIHHISEVNSLGVAVDEDINIQLQKYRGVSHQLRQTLLSLLSTLKSNLNSQPESRNLIEVIEKHLKVVEDWIAFPKLIEIPKQVVREVQKQKIVLVPTQDKEKQVVLSYLLDKLLTELKRVRDVNQIPLELDEYLLKLFFDQAKTEEGLEAKLAELSSSLKHKKEGFGSWQQSNPFLVNSFLQDHFSLKALVEESNRIQSVQVDQINNLRHQLDIATNKYQNLLCFNRKMYDDNSTLIRTLQKYRDTIQDEHFNENLRTHRDFYDQLAEDKHTLVLSSIRKTYQQTDSIIDALGQQGEGENRQQALAQLVGKLSQYENRNQELVTRTKLLENEVQKYAEELNLRNTVIKRLQNEFESKLTRSREELARNPNLNKQLLEENRKLQERNRVLETEKLAAERVKKELERNIESTKREGEGRLERKEREAKDLLQKANRQAERQINRIKSECERLQKDKERLERELAENRRRTSEQIEAAKQQQVARTSHKQQQLITQNIDLRAKNDALSQEYEKLRKAASENNASNDRQLSRLRQQNERLNNERREWQKKRNQGLGAASQQTQRRNTELTQKIDILQSELAQLRVKDEQSIGELTSLRDKFRRLQAELETTRKEMEVAQKSKIQSTTLGSTGNKPRPSVYEVFEGLGSASRSPRGSGYRSPLEKEYLSPEISESRQELPEGFVSSESRVSKQSSEQLPRPSPYSSQMTLREFMQIKNPDQKERDLCITYIMIKVIEKLQLQVQTGRFNSYSPSNIIIGNFNVKNLEEIVVKLGYPITNKNNKNDGLYLSPEVLGGAQASKKSIVFSLGIILDQLIHGSNFFKSTDELQNPQIEFRVRAEKMNPILKNTLFQMMTKDPNKRLELLEAKRRLSLQKFITSESRGSITTSTRYGRG